MTDTLGQTVDAELAVVKARLAVLESAVVTDFSVAKAWVKSNWAHIVLTWPAAVSVLAPVVRGLLKL